MKLPCIPKPPLQPLLRPCRRTNFDHHHLRTYANLVSTPADPIPPAFPEIQTLRKHPQRRMLPHNDATRIYRRSLLAQEAIAPSPERSRFPLRELGRERLYLRIAQLDPYTYGRDRLVWESYTAKVHEAYRAHDFDIGVGWVKQHASLREAARETLLGLMESDDALKPHPGLWDWDLIEWKLHRAHSNVKEWLRRNMKITDVQMGQAQQAGKEMVRERQRKRLFLSDEELAARIDGVEGGIGAVREKTKRTAEMKVLRAAQGVRLGRGRPKVKAYVRPRYAEKMRRGRLKKGEVRQTLDESLRAPPLQKVKMKRGRPRRDGQKETSEDWIKIKQAKAPP